MLIDATHRRALPQYHSVETKILNVPFPRVESEPTTCHVYSHAPLPLRHD